MLIVDVRKALNFLMFIFYKLKLQVQRCLNFDLLTFYLPLFFFLVGDAEMVYKTLKLLFLEK